MHVHTHTNTHVTAGIPGVVLTPSQHMGTLADAVIIVLVLGAEVGSVDHQAALSSSCPTVALKKQPEHTHIHTHTYTNTHTHTHTKYSSMTGDRHRSIAALF